MNYLAFNSSIAARIADTRAFEYVKSQDGAEGAQWSGIYTNGTLFGIVFDNSIAGAFTPEELAGVVASETTWDLVQ